MLSFTHRHNIRGLSPEPKKYCNQHAGFSEEEGGEWITSADGMRRTFKCAGCIRTEKERARETTVSMPRVSVALLKAAL